MTRLLKYIASYKTTLRLKMFLVASLLAIIPVILLGAITYFVTVFNTEREIGKSNRETIHQIQQRIDEKLLILDKIALQHIFNPTVEDFLELSNPYSDVRAYNEVSSILHSMEVLNPNIDSAYIYLTKKDMVFTSENGLIDSEILDHRVLTSFKEISKPHYFLDYKTEVTLPRGGSHKVTMVRRIPVNSGNPLGYLIINLNERGFFEVFRDVRLGRSGELIILTPNGTIWADWNKNLLDEELDTYDFLNNIADSTKNESTFTTQIEEQTMLINYMKSEYNGWKYVSVIPMNELTAQSKLILNTTLIICLILTFTSLLAAMFLSGRFYSLIHNMIDYIKKTGRYEVATSRNIDEFGYIKEYFESINNENNLLNEKILETKKQLKDHFMKRVLTEYLKEEEIRERFDYYGIKYYFPFFTVVSVEVDEFETMEEKTVDLIISNMINTARKNLYDYQFNGSIVEMQMGRFSIIINHHVHEEVNNNLIQMSQRLCNFVRSSQNATVTIGIGRTYKDVENIRQSFIESNESIRYRLVKGKDTVISIQQVHSDGYSYIYPIETEELVIKHLKLGDINKINELLDEFIGFLKGRNNQNYSGIIQGINQLVGSTLKEVYLLDPKNRLNLFPYDPYQKLNQFQTMEQISCWLKDEVYPVIVNYIRTLRDNDEHQLIESALVYIHNNYDKDLSQPMVAEVLSIPSPQFSTLFKRVVGMTFTDYLIIYRMEKAKELLTNTDLKIIEIANRLCYNNSQNFIRVFKKINGVTPGEFRTQQQVSFNKNLYMKENMP